MSETPRTQAGIDDWINTGEISVLRDIAEEMELELMNTPWAVCGKTREEWFEGKRIKYHELLSEIKILIEQRDRLEEALKEEMEWAKDQSHLCDKESVEREQKNDDLGSRYYDGLSVAFYQSMRRLQYRLMPLQSLTTNAERIHGEKDA
jgi:hypothetical protein